MDDQESVEVPVIYGTIRDKPVPKWSPEKDWEKKMADREAREDGPRKQKTVARLEPAEMAQMLLEREMMAARRRDEEAHKQWIEEKRLRALGEWQEQLKKVEAATAATLSVETGTWTTGIGEPPAGYEYQWGSVLTGSGGVGGVIVGVPLVLDENDEVVDLTYDPSKPCYRIPKRKIQHKAGHFPIEWMTEAFERCLTSDKLMRVELAKEGVVVIGTEGDNYETHVLPWKMMECAEVNPIPLAIETVERHLNTLYRLKEKVGVVAKENA